MKMLPGKFLDVPVLLLSALIIILYASVLPEPQYAGGRSPAMQRFVNAYAEYISSVSADGITLVNGQYFRWDDGKQKTFDERFENADIEDMLSQEYVAGNAAVLPPPKNFSPGRIRNEAFFMSIYGASPSDVRKNCARINWFGRSVLFNKRNGAADSLIAVRDELINLPARFIKYLRPAAGTFNWRKIAGTRMLSMHALALSIDINTTYSDYWRNHKDMQYRNKIPAEIVTIFEKHGFIWGGKWYHYDTMHFEFRPEFFVFARRANG